MIERLSAACLAISLAIFAGSAQAAEEPQKVELCALKADPAAYTRKLIDVSGVVSHDFENFQLSDPACEKSVGVWLEYGGTLNSGTIYCCGVSGARKRRSEALTVEDVSTSLVEDAIFKRFDARVQSKSKGRISFRATLRGRFFAGNLEKTAGGTPWPGYGHIGCCSLLVIQQVLMVQSDAR